MGCKILKDKQKRIKQPSQTQREVGNDRRRQSVLVKVQCSRYTKRLVDLQREEIQHVISHAEVIKDERDQQKLTLYIGTDICKSFNVCPCLESRKLVMGRVLSIKEVFANTPNYILPTKVAIAQQVLARVNTSLIKLPKPTLMPNWHQSGVYLLPQLMKSQTHQ